MRWYSNPLSRGLVLAGAGVGAVLAQSKPNIIFIMTDDQDLHHNSLDHMPKVKSLMTEQGTYLSNHWATDAMCCPSRATVLRGQQAHNTNITHVRKPGGNYDKWLAADLDLNYLPHWLVNAGYSTNYIGKLLNGVSLGNYDPAPKGWSDIDTLLEPYMYDPNRAVLSKNGNRPVAYPGWHQTDIIRIKALKRLQELVDEGGPFYYQIAPTAPHNIPGGELPQPLLRYNNSFPDLTLPKNENWNPEQSFTDQKRYWLQDLDKLNSTQVAQGETLYKTRIRTLQGIDELVEDVIGFLEDNNLLENTYVIYTSDNGYLIGSHRIPAAKCLGYREAGNLPFIVRGPGIPAGASSTLPSTHTDLAPTFLEIAGVAPADYPVLFDGRSVLAQWHNPTGDGTNDGDTDTSQASKEIIQVEFWGEADIELPYPVKVETSTFKALRIVGDDFSYLYLRWCTNGVELYNTIDDPWEMTNLAINPTEDNARLLKRLNALNLILKSCESGTCRDPWQLIASNVTEGIGSTSSPGIASLKQALEPRFDAYFDTFPNVHFDQCLLTQEVANEMPFFPANASEGLGLAHRTYVSDWTQAPFQFSAKVPRNDPIAGTEAQRTASYQDLIADERDLTDGELGITSARSVDFDLSP